MEDVEYLKMPQADYFSPRLEQKPSAISQEAQTRGCVYVASHNFSDVLSILDVHGLSRHR